MRIVLFLLSVCLLGCQASVAQEPTTFTLTSTHLSGQATPDEVFQGCGGKNKSPQLSWVNAPEGTKSFAITMYDPDAPTGSGWWHWLVVNIPADVTSLEQEAGNPKTPSLPKGVLQTLNDYGESGYGGPCPPAGHGLHQYIITIHALKTNQLKVEATTNPAVVGYQINANTIGKASLVFYHQTK